MIGRQCCENARGEFGDLCPHFGVVPGARHFPWVSRRSAFTVATVIFGGLFVGRLASLWADGGLSGYGGLIRALYVIDAVGLTLTVTAMLLDSGKSDAKIVGVR